MTFCKQASIPVFWVKVGEKGRGGQGRGREFYSTVNEVPGSSHHGFHSSQRNTVLKHRVSLLYYDLVPTGTSLYCDQLLRPPVMSLVLYFLPTFFPRLLLQTCQSSPLLLQWPRTCWCHKLLPREQSQGCSVYLYHQLVPLWNLPSNYLGLINELTVLLRDWLVLIHWGHCFPLSGSLRSLFGPSQPCFQADLSDLDSSAQVSLNAFLLSWINDRIFQAQSEMLLTSRDGISFFPRILALLSGEKY